MFWVIKKNLKFCLRFTISIFRVMIYLYLAIKLFNLFDFHLFCDFTDYIKNIGNIYVLNIDTLQKFDVVGSLIQ